MTLSQDAINTLKVDMYEQAMQKADKSLSEIRTSLRSSGSEDAKFIASELLRVILTLREAME